MGSHPRSGELTSEVRRLGVSQGIDSIESSHDLPDRSYQGSLRFLHAGSLAGLIRLGGTFPGRRKESRDVVDFLGRTYTLGLLSHGDLP